MAKDAPDKIYRIAALSLPTNIATMFKEVYAGTDDVSKKFSIYQSLWKQVADLRGANLTPEANTMSRVLSQKGNMRTGLGDDILARKALLPSEMNTKGVLTVMLQEDLVRKHIVRQGQKERRVGKQNPSHHSKRNKHKKPIIRWVFFYLPNG